MPDLGWQRHADDQEQAETGRSLEDLRDNLAWFGEQWPAYAATAWLARRDVETVLADGGPREHAVTLYETNADLVLAQLDAGVIWQMGPVTPDMYGTFAATAAAWIAGEWEPNEADGQSPGTADGIVPVAAWRDAAQDVTLLAPWAEIGGAARLWLTGRTDTPPGEEHTP